MKKIDLMMSVGYVNKDSRTKAVFSPQDLKLQNSCRKVKSQKKHSSQEYFIIINSNEKERDDMKNKIKKFKINFTTRLIKLKIIVNSNHLVLFLGCGYLFFT